MNTYIKTGEEVLELLLAKISLSRYDRKFFQSLQVSNVYTNKPITSNQLALFKKVVSKYHRQLATLNYNAIDLVDTPWTLKIIESSGEFTKPIIKIEGDKIVVRTPYKLNFVKDFRAAFDKQITWDHETKSYSGEFGLFTLKKIIEITRKHYDEIVFSDDIHDILQKIETYQNAKVWDPVLVRRNGNLYIACINEVLNEVTKDIPLATDIKTIAALIKFGIKIDDELISELSIEMGEEYNKKLKFVSSRVTEVDQLELGKINPWLNEIGCDYILYSTMFSKNGLDDVAETLDGFEISYDITYSARYVSFGKSNQLGKNLLLDRKCNMPVMVKYGKLNHKHHGAQFAAKIIELVNNEPVEIK
jgi:hypothetical protein